MVFVGGGGGGGDGGFDEGDAASAVTSDADNGGIAGAGATLAAMMINVLHLVI